MLSPDGARPRDVELIHIPVSRRQTQGGRFPFLFSQCQPIYARSLVPLQGSSFAHLSRTARAHVSSDTPSVKFVRRSFRLIICRRLTPPERHMTPISSLYFPY